MAHRGFVVAMIVFICVHKNFLIQMNVSLLVGFWKQ